jgi:hypothetical protein
VRRGRREDVTGIVIATVDAGRWSRQRFSIGKIARRSASGRCGRSCVNVGAYNALPAGVELAEQRRNRQGSGRRS